MGLMMSRIPLWDFNTWEDDGVACRPMTTGTDGRLPFSACSLAIVLWT